MISSLLFLGGIGFQELILLFFVLVIPAALWIAAILSLLKSNQDSTNKLIWAMVILFVPFLGALLYLVVGRKQGRVTS
jgi:hypothetical protein